MKILLTGASGFLGEILQLALKSEEIVTLSRKNALIEIDLARAVPKLEHFDVVIHSAGKAHAVPRSAKDINEFYDVNVNGTRNLLTGLAVFGPPKSFIYISSVAVYGLGTGKLISEDAPLLATDPYGKSKIEAERLVKDWCKENAVTCTVLRLPLIAGANPKGNLQAMIKGIISGYYFNIDRGQAKKSIVLADDIAEIIPACIKTGGTYNLTDGYDPSFLELSTVVSRQLGVSAPKCIPLWFAKVIAHVGDLFGARAPLNSSKLSKITSDLTFSDASARKMLGWNPRPVLTHFKVLSIDPEIGMSMKQD